MPPLTLDDECTNDFCLVNGVSIAAEKTAESGNVTVEQTIMVYSQPITKDLLTQAFEESYPEHSQWNVGEQTAPKVGNASIAFNYTILEDIGPKDPARTGYVYEVFKSTNGSLDDLKEVVEIGAEKLNLAY